MNYSLFGPADGIQEIVVPEADVKFWDRMPLREDLDYLLSCFINEIPWRIEKVKVWGKEHNQPRLTAWYGDIGREYAYSGVKLSPLPWNDTLLSIKDQIETQTALHFNSVLLNYYRDNNDCMGFHSDNERELGPKPPIASLSIGADRRLIFKNKRGIANDVTVLLQSGSLLLMKGDTQANWKHGIPRESRFCGPRVNLTFRRILGS